MASEMRRRTWEIMVTSDAPITATAVFSQFSGVPGSGTLLAEAAVTSVDESGNLRTGLAVANPSQTTPANLTFGLHGVNTGGVAVLTTTRPPFGAVNHTSLFVDALFSTTGQDGGITDPLAVGHVGTLNVTSDVPIALVSLRFNGALFTSVPPFSLAGMFSPVIAPLGNWLNSHSWPEPLVAFARILTGLRSSLG